jgi:hypothetical protein
MFCGFESALVLLQEFQNALLTALKVPSVKLGDVYTRTVCKKDNSAR